MVAAIVTGSFSWGGFGDSYWLAAALWYCSLLLSVLGMLTASTHIAVLDILGLPHPTGNIKKSEESSARRNVRRFLPVMLSEVKRANNSVARSKGRNDVRRAPSENEQKVESHIARANHDVESNLARGTDAINPNSAMNDDDADLSNAWVGNDVGLWQPRWKMIFVWQCPTMFLSYSVCFYLIGLTIFVCSPLIQGDSGSQAYVSGPHC